MEERVQVVTYYGRKSKTGNGYEWIVRIDDSGCYVTDPIEDWEKDDDYRDEAESNNLLYEKLDKEKAAHILGLWKRSMS